MKPILASELDDIFDDDDIVEIENNDIYSNIIFKCEGIFKNESRYFCINNVHCFSIRTPITRWIRSTINVINECNMDEGKKYRIIFYNYNNEKVFSIDIRIKKKGRLINHDGYLYYEFTPLNILDNNNNHFELIFLDYFNNTEMYLTIEEI